MSRRKFWDRHSWMYLYELTGDSRYLDQIEAEMEVIRHSLAKEEASPHSLTTEELYWTIPFYMAYETKIGKKENYHKLVQLLKQYGKDPKFSMQSDTPIERGWYLMTLVDTLDEMSETVYEHYRILQDLIRQIMRISGSTLYDSADLQGNVMAAYATMKACSKTLISKEKYEDPAMQCLRESDSVGLADGDLIRQIMAMGWEQRL
ncbi:MAG: hypothetical protein RR590_05805 [Hungatella sp.]